MGNRQHVSVRKKIIFLLLFLLCIVILLWISYRILNGNQLTSHINVDKKELDTYLASKQYDRYQSISYRYAERFIEAKDFQRAQEMLDDVKKSVPKSSLSADFYRSQAVVYKIEGSKEKYYRSQEQYIEMLRKEGYEQLAQQMQIQLEKDKRKGTMW